MHALTRLGQWLYGSDQRLRRMLQYWAATVILYVICISLIHVQVRHGATGAGSANALTVYGAVGTLSFYVLIRFNEALGLAADKLAVAQAIFSLAAGMWAYTISGPVRAATMTMTIVTVAFCMFALRPRQSLLLAATAIVGMGGTMWWLQAADPVRYPPLAEFITFGYLAGALLSTAILSGEMSKLRARLKHKKRKLTEALDTINILACVDELTSLVNRRRMNEVLEEEERRQARDGACVALLDIDFFKQVNDRHGHAVGDAVLRNFAAATRAALRGQDVLARWGGEEFLLLLPDTTLDEARLVLNRMAERVHAMQVPGVDAARRISFSAGLAARREREPFADAINRADKALYRAKEAGRDRIELA